MPRRVDSKNIGLQLTPAEFAALNVFAELTGREKSEVVRAALAAYIPGYPDDAGIATRQKAENKKPVKVDETT